MTRDPLVVSIWAIIRRRAISCIFFRRTGWSMERMKNPQKISEIPMFALLSRFDAGDELLYTRMASVLGGGKAPVVWPPGQGGDLPGRRVHGRRLSPHSCLARLPPVSARGVGTRRAMTPGMPRTA